MKYVRLGTSGISVSRIGLGMMSYGDPRSLPWALDEEASAPIVRRAVESGITFFDTADMYSDGASEEVTGRLLARYFRQRDDYVLATKVYYPTGTGPNDRGLSRKHIMAAIDASLRRLGTDHVDVYQIHRWDNETPIEETMAALDEVVRAGKARYIGASLMRAWQLDKAQRAAGSNRFVSMQTRYNLLYREEEREMLPYCLAEGVGVIAYSPLARGRLAANRGATGPSLRAREDTAPSRDAVNDADVVAAVRAVAAGRAVPAGQVALAWLLGQPAVSTPIVGATRSEHLDDAVAAIDLTLSPGETASLEAPYRPREPYGYS
jgi:aryl-alcohol dehydrogenase-like predicted oxidoreductase